MDIRLANADFSQNAVGFALEYEVGLKGLFFLWDDLERAVINLAGGPNLIVKGAPVIATGGYFAACKGLSNYFESLMYETSEMTVIIACWNPDALAAGQTMYFGNFSGDAQPYAGANPAPNGGLISAGLGVYSSASNLIRGLSARFTAGSPDVAESTPTTLSEAPSALAFYSFDAGSTGPNYTRLKSWATGTVTLGATSTFNKPRLPNKMPFRVGSGHVTYAGLANVSMLAVFEGRLTDAQIRLNVLAMRDELQARKGIALPVAA